jgi:catechol 2,3-dioxygenase-like lactoylglutathione lyase family enzyme
MSNLLIKQLDHLVLTVKNIEETVRFYESVLGMKKEIFGEGRVALKFGRQKINLHEAGKEWEPKAHHPQPGSADLCLVTDTELRAAMAHVQSQGVDIIEGPVCRLGANGPMLSFYFRDPDLNLIEISTYQNLT